LQNKKNKKVKRISKNTAYKKGRQLEYRVVKHFQKLGYYARRNYASKGAEDVNAMKRITIPGSNFKCSEILHIQCKNLKVEKPLNKTEADNLKALAKITGGTPLLAQNINHKLVITEVE
jgi:Holliday junction resolvase